MNTTFYATQSAVSDPGRYAYLFDNLPRDFVGIAQIVQGLVYHYASGQYTFGYQPPQDRIGEIDTRTIERILGRVLEMDNRPLTEPRTYENRLVGCCRDFALIACAILRHHDIPARLRYGFASYFDHGYWEDHVIVEAWNGTRWQRFDAQFGTASALLDISETDYITGGRAWQMCRSEGADPARFGLGPHVPDVSGWWLIRGRLLLDSAALDKHELLCWDEWSYGQTEVDLNAEEETLLDTAAALSLESDSTALRDLCANDARLRVPGTVLCYSPAIGPQQVKLD